MARTIFFGFVVFLFLAYHAEAFDNVLSAINQQLTSLKKIPNRMKRDIGALCTLSCVDEYITNVEMFMPQMEEVMFQIVPIPEISANRFKEFCSSYFIQFYECISSCPKSESSDVAKVLFSANRFMCIDHRDDYARYWQCYLNEYKIDKSDCISKSEPCKNVTFNFSQQWNQTFVEASNFLNQNCESIRCSLPCILKSISNQCGPEAANLFEIFATLLMRALFELQHLTIEPFTFPEECLKLISNATIMLE